MKQADRFSLVAFVFGDSKKNACSSDRLPQPQVFVSVETKVWYLCRPVKGAGCAKPSPLTQSEFLRGHRVMRLPFAPPGGAGDHVEIF